MRTIRHSRHMTPIAALVAAMLLIAACTDDGADSGTRSPAPTGSLTPASSAEASASPSAAGDLPDGQATIELVLTTR